LPAAATRLRRSIDDPVNNTTLTTAATNGTSGVNGTDATNGTVAINGTVGINGTDATNATRATNSTADLRTADFALELGLVRCRAWDSKKGDWISNSCSVSR